MIINPGIDRFHCRQAIALADLYSHVYAAVGIHPNSSFELYAPDCNLPAGTASQGQGSNGVCNEQTLTELRQLAAHPKVVAIGEIGAGLLLGQGTPATDRCRHFGRNFS